MSFAFLIARAKALMGIVPKPPVVSPFDNPIVITPGPTPAPIPSRPVTGTTIAIRGNFAGVFYPQEVPFRSSEPIDAKDVGRRKWYVEVTVLTGELKITDLFTTKLHSPRFKGVVEGTYRAGEKFTAQLILGPLGPHKSSYSYAMWGIHTAELGEIVNIQAQVAHPR